MSFLIDTSVSTQEIPFIPTLLNFFSIKNGYIFKFSFHIY